MLTITEGVLIRLVEEFNVDATNIIDLLHTGETNVIDHSFELLAGGWVDKNAAVEALTPSQRRNILATPREESFIDSLIDRATGYGHRGLFR